MMDSKLEQTIGLGLQEAGLWPYPEFIRLFADVFTHQGTKEQVDKADKLIKGGLNVGKMSKLYETIQALKDNLGGDK
jgi:hypothetical protein